MTAFYFDHNVSHRVASLLEAYGHTVITARARGLDAATDDEHFLLAAQQRWTLVTHNASDFLLLHNAWHRWLPAFGISPPHFGVLIIPHPPQWDASRAARELDAFVAREPPLLNALYAWRPQQHWVRRALI